MRKCFLLGTVLSSLALLGVVGFGRQSMTFGKTLGEAGAAKAWGGCTSGWIEVPNGACTTWGPSNCSWDSIYGCVNECEVNCTPVNTYTAGGELYGGLSQVQWRLLCCRFATAVTAIVHARVLQVPTRAKKTRRSSPCASSSVEECRAGLHLIAFDDRR